MVGYFCSSSRSSSSNAMWGALIGVGLSSIGSGLGESSLLALAGRYENMERNRQREDEENTQPQEGKKKGVYLTLFSSGTGACGVFGFLWTSIFVDVLHLSFTTSLLFANFLALGYYLTFISVLTFSEGAIGEIPDDENSIELRIQDNRTESYTNIETDDYQYYHDDTNLEEDYKLINRPGNEVDDHDLGETQNKITPLDQINVQTCSLYDRTRLVLSLWPYMIPLFTVYFAEYALQSGAWTSIGFPSPQDPKARAEFYHYGNWIYQIGVFLSRSSGTIFNASLTTLWILPGIQFSLLLFFIWVVAIYHIWYSWSLLILCFLAGLLGGGVYVNAYTRINSDIPAAQNEFALSSASVADSFGIILADVTGLFIQSCLYMSNNIPGAEVSCPIK